ncbi:hypothetical protein PSENEW3_00006046 [Picochlorum sp. SENEW3]|nr:hypothetical protein PSENEW3_00006046 [Picochlorum sp. SENEW3]
MNDEDEFGKSPLGVSSKQRTQVTQHKNIDENEEGRGRRALNFSEATETQQGKDESTFGEQDLYGDLYGAGEGGEQKEGVGILRLKVSRLMSDIGVKDSMISRLEKTVQELQDEVGFYVFARNTTTLRCCSSHAYQGRIGIHLDVCERWMDYNCLSAEANNCHTRVPMQFKTAVVRNIVSNEPVFSTRNPAILTPAMPEKHPNVLDKPNSLPASLGATSLIFAVNCPTDVKPRASVIATRACPGERLPVANASSAGTGPRKATVCIIFRTRVLFHLAEFTR